MKKVKVAIFIGNGQAMASITVISPNGVFNTRFLIHQNLLLITHTNLFLVVAPNSTTTKARFQNMSRTKTVEYPHSPPLSNWRHAQP